MKKRLLGCLAGLMAAICLSVSAAELKPNHPEFYVVQPGDTLWDISQKFLNSPWLWPEIWHVNEQVDNPHLIFPGDIISLVYIDGKPRITKTNRYPDGTIKLSPKARELTADQAITTIPLDAILPFLTSMRVVSEEELKVAPYVLGADNDRIMAAADHKVYVRGIDKGEFAGANKFTFFRRGDNYIDPVTGEFLGIEAIHLGEGLKVQGGDPSIVRVTSSVLEIHPDDNLWPTNDEQLRPVYFPHAPENFAGGQIISVYGGVQHIGQYDVVVINRGERDGMEVGHVLGIYRKGQKVVDRIATERRREKSNFWENLTGDKEVVVLPDERSGELMIFRTFEKVSLGLVLKAERSIYVLDKVKAPE